MLQLKSFTFIFLNSRRWIRSSCISHESHQRNAGNAFDIYNRIDYIILFCLEEYREFVLHVHDLIQSMNRSPGNLRLYIAGMWIVPEVVEELKPLSCLMVCLINENVENRLTIGSFGSKILITFHVHNYLYYTCLLWIVFDRNGFYGII